MATAAEQVIDLIFGRWRSQVLAAGIELGIFDRLDRAAARTARELAADMGVDTALLYRLLRAQASIGLLVENSSGGFTLNENGDLLRTAHSCSLAAMARLEEGPQHYALWKHLPAMIRDGKQNAFVREFGHMAFDHTKIDRDYAERFDQAMASYSPAHAVQVLKALQGADLSGVRVFCDVAGGHGYLICALLSAYPWLSGIVLDSPAVVADSDALRAPKLGLEARCSYVGGDMFKEVPKADAYGLKRILHDWNDEECVAILENIRRAAAGTARVFIMEQMVPGPDMPHFAKLFDIHMMCWGTGRERTETEYTELLRHAGWRKVASHNSPGNVISVIEGACG